jgi:xylulokinase
MMGIDVGTTGTRAVIVRPDGSVAGAATGAHQPMRMEKAGWAEQDPEDWWHATIVAVRTALNQAGLKGSDVSAVGLSGQMHGVVLLDRTNAVVRPSLIWCDQRSQAQCDWITSRVGADRLIEPLRAHGALSPAQGFRAFSPHRRVRHRRFRRLGNLTL